MSPREHQAPTTRARPTVVSLCLLGQLRLVNEVLSLSHRVFEVQPEGG